MNLKSINSLYKSKEQESKHQIDMKAFLEGICNWHLNGHYNQMAKRWEMILVFLEGVSETLQHRLLVCER